MLTIRSFNNMDPANILSIWNSNADVVPEKYFPMQSDLLEAQFFGNSLFDPDGFLLALDDGVPVGFIQASFGPNRTGSTIDPSAGVVFAPILLKSRRNDQTAQELILAAEKYLWNKGATHCFAGGLGKVSPFYTGLYGKANPFGVLADDTDTIRIFERLGYKFFRRAVQLRLDVMRYQAPVNDTILQTHRLMEVRRNASWAARNWWDANIYRNFTSYEWNVFPRDNHNPYPEPVAGAVIHQMLVPALFATSQSCILSFIGVLETSLRKGIGSVLFSSLINDLQYECCIPTTLEVSIPEENKSLSAFLKYHSFHEVGGYVSMCKVYDPNKPLGRL